MDDLRGCDGGRVRPEKIGRDEGSPAAQARATTAAASANGAGSGAAPLGAAQIEKSLQSQDEFIRANAVEAAQNALGADARKEIIGKLEDPSPVVRFAAAMATGQLRLEEAHDKLLELANDPDTAVQIGARFALHRIGDVRYSHDLEKYARDNDPQVRGNTAMVLGMLEEKSAMKILRC